jgi:hypothetical protein
MMIQSWVSVDWQRLAHCNRPKLSFPPDTGNHTKNKKDKPLALHLPRQWKLMQTTQLSSGLVSAQDYDDPIKYCRPIFSANQRPWVTPSWCFQMKIHPWMVLAGAYSS